jgi:penicillin-binding protein 2
VHVQPIPPTRGLIFDRNGVVVADNRPSFSLSMTRERSGRLAASARCDRRSAAADPEDRVMFERAKQGRRPFEPVPILFELTEEQIARIAVNQFRLPGVEVVAQLVRHYPQGAHFAHSVGYMGGSTRKS